MRLVLPAFGRILLALVLLMQAGPLCACSIEHTILCDDAALVTSDLHEATGNTGHSCDDPCCTAPASCPTHSHGHQSCSAGSRSKALLGSAADVLPAMDCTAPISLVPPAPRLQQHWLQRVLPDLPPDAARSFPLLN